MGQPLSMDLRSRLLGAVDAGMSCRSAADRFGVAPSTAIRWQAQRRATGNFAPKPQGGDTRSRRVEEYREMILALWEARKDITLDELRAELSGIGLVVANSTLHRFFVRHGITRKKDRPRDRAGPARRPEPAPRLVRRATRPRSGASGLHRRNVDRDQHDPQPWPVRQGRASEDGLPAWASQNDHAGGRPADEWNDRSDGARRADQRRLVRSLCRPGSRTRAALWRHRRHG